MSKLISTNPSKNYQVIGEVDISSPLEIEKKVNSAHEARILWKEIGLQKRIEHLRKVQSNLYTRKEELAKLAAQEMGMPIKNSLEDVDDAIMNYMQWYLENAEKALTPETTFEDEMEIHQYFYEPTGIAAVISPWNFPISNWVWGVVPNLIVGNTVIFKHSEEVPLTSKLIENIISETNLPAGVLSHIYGDGVIGEILLDQDVNLISFTGSTKTGKHIYELAGKKFVKCLMELGGSAPGIIFKDVNLNEIINTVASQRLSNCGQCCDGLKRLLVHTSIYEETVSKLKEIFQSKKIGDPENYDTEIGPLVAERQLETALAQLNDAVEKGAKIETGGKRPETLQGAYIEPTVLTNITPEMRVWKEEVFAPILPVIKFSSDEEATKLANDTMYGLGSYIYTNDPELAISVASRVETGMVSINGKNYVCPWNIFGGTKASGKGREHGVQGLRELCEIKLIARNK